MNSATDTKPGPYVALLVDGENISVDFAGAMIIRAAKFGKIAIQRVYGNAGKLQNWDAAPGFRLIHSGSGKNGADILLSIEAVDLAHSAPIGTFVIATSDQDFSHLAHHLRERSFKVVGIGEAKAPVGFRRACSEFIELAAKAGAAPKALNPLDEKIHELIREASDNEMRIAVLGPRMYKRFGERISTYPSKNWSAYLASKPDLYACDPKGPEACVRLTRP